MALGWRSAAQLQTPLLTWLPPERRKPEYTHHFEYAVDRPKLMAEPLKEAHNLNGLGVSCSNFDPAPTRVGFRNF